MGEIAQKAAGPAGEHDLLKTLATTIVAVWGFYGVTLLAVLQAFVFAKDAIRGDAHAILCCVAMFLILNYAALAGLQIYAAFQVPGKAARWAHIGSTVMLALHAMLDRTAYLVIESTLSKCAVCQAS